MSADLKEVLVRHYLTGESVIEWARDHVSREQDAVPEINRIAGLSPEDEQQAADLLTKYLEDTAPGFVPRAKEWCELARSIFLAECDSFVKGDTPVDRYAKVVLSMEDLCHLPQWLQNLSEACSSVLLSRFNPYGASEEETREMSDFMREEAERCLIVFGFRKGTS